MGLSGALERLLGAKTFPVCTSYMEDVKNFVSHWAAAGSGTGRETVRPSGLMDTESDQNPSTKHFGRITMEATRASGILH
jgi:hypothetical protein